MTRDQIQKFKERSRELKRLEKVWAPTVSKWRKAVTGEDSIARDVALSEIRALRQVDAFPIVEEITLAPVADSSKVSEEYRLISSAFMDALIAMPDHAATLSIVRHAVYSPVPEVHGRAIE